MSAFTQSDSFSRTVHNGDSFWSLSTDLVYSHLLPPSKSLFSASCCYCCRILELGQCATTMSTHHSWSVPQPMLGTYAALHLDRWTCLSKVCHKFFCDKNLLLLLKNAFVFFFLSSFSNFYSPSPAFWAGRRVTGRIMISSASVEKTHKNFPPRVNFFLVFFGLFFLPSEDQKPYFKFKIS